MSDGADAEVVSPSRFQGRTLEQWRKIEEGARNNADWNIACIALRAINILKGEIKCTSTFQPQ